MGRNSAREPATRHAADRRRTLVTQARFVHNFATGWRLTGDERWCEAARLAVQGLRGKFPLTPTGRGELLAVGAAWTGLMLGFDLWFGRWVFRFPWQRIARDFDLRRGGLLGLGMLLPGLSPWLAAWLRS